MQGYNTILVTGATGLIGSQIVKTLMNDGGTNVIALSRSESKLKEIFHKYDGMESFKYIAHDMCEPFDFESVMRDGIKTIDAVFHAASPISGATIKQVPLDVIRPNLFATQYILEGLVNQQRKTGVKGRIIIFSSATVYGKGVECDTIVNESETMHADVLESQEAPYSESKRMLEVIARGYVKQHEVDAVIARLSYVYGSSFFAPDTAMYEFISNALSGQDINLLTSDAGRRDNIYINDAVSGLFTLLNKGKTGESYNISSGGALGNFAAMDEIAEVIVGLSDEVLSKKINVRYKMPKGAPRKPGMILDNSKLKALGWDIEKGLVEGIKDTLLNQSLGR